MPLASKDALNEDTRLRRDHFLRMHGFDVVYADAQHLKASIEGVQVGELLNNWNTEKVQFVEILEAAQMLQQAEQTLQEQEVKLREKEEKVSKFQPSQPKPPDSHTSDYYLFITIQRFSTHLVNTTFEMISCRIGSTEHNYNLSSSFSRSA